MNRFVFLAVLFAATQALADDGGSDALKAFGGFGIIVIALLSIAYLRRLVQNLATAIQQGPRALLGLQRVLVDTFQNGVLYRNGAFERVLTPGVHWIRPKGARMVTVDMRPQVFQIALVAISADRMRVELRAIARVQVADARAAVESATNYRDELVARLQSTLKNLAGEWSFRDIHLRQADFNRAVQTLAGAAIQSAGAACISFELMNAESGTEAPAREEREIGFRTH
jgi:uncharacterized membrane protein YqiK